jgi:hypothetical protein
MLTQSNMPINLRPDQDIWDYLIPMYESWPTARLLSQQAYFRDAIEKWEQKNPIWAARCAQPNLGIINIILLLRNASLASL